MTVDDTFPPLIWSSMIDERAKATPSRVFCEIHEDDWREAGSREITYAQFARAVDRLCWWLDNEFGPSKDIDSFTYVGDNDLRYTMAMVAAQKSGRLMVIAELNRLTHPALLLLLEDTKCFRWLGGSEAQMALGNALPAERPGIELHTLPPLNHWLEDGDVQAYPFEKSWEEVRTIPYFVIHSSGTTGIPKTMPYSLEMLGVMDFMHRYPDGTNENPNIQLGPLFDARALWVAPPQWLGGLVGHLALPLYFDMLPIWPPVHEPAPTPAPIVEEILKRTNPDGAFCVPSTLRDLCLKENSLELVKKLKFVVYAGAPLDQWVGDLLCTELKLMPCTGSTETNLWAMQTLDDPRDWNYYHFDERVGIKLEHFDGDMYEVVMQKKPEYRRFQGAFIMFPEREVYHTEDLYTPHPTKPGLLRYRGRKDDLLKLQWLTKVRASDMETSLALKPQVSEAMVGGEGKPTPFAILQLSGSGEKLDENEIWSIIQELNEKLSAEVHIPRENIIVADESRPLRKLGKGTLDRRRILEDYKEEINRIYGEPATLNGENGTVK